MGTQRASLCLCGALLAVATWFVPTSAWAEMDNKEDHKVDISDLENKYWAPKDTDFSVVQNRAFPKEGRVLLTPQLGRPINNPWSTGMLYGLTANYFWSERMGAQFTYLKADFDYNQTVKELTQFGSGVSPDHGRMTGYMGAGFNLVPFYAKMSFWGKRIIYFDMAITPTIGMTQYNQIIKTGNRAQSAVTLGLDITQFFFFTKNFAVRADLKNQWRPEEIVSNAGVNPGQKIKDQITQDTLFLLGLTFFY